MSQIKSIITDLPHLYNSFKSFEHKDKYIYEYIKLGLALCPNKILDETLFVSFLRAYVNSDLTTQQYLLLIKPDIDMIEYEYHTTSYENYAQLKIILESKSYVDNFGLKLHDEIFEYQSYTAHFDINKIFKYLLCRKPTIGTKCIYNHNDTFRNLCKNSNLYLAKLILNIKQIDVNYDNDLILRNCCSVHNINLQIIQWLLTLFQTINISIYDEFAFIAACDNQRYDIANFLLRSKPDIDIYNTNYYLFYLAISHITKGKSNSLLKYLIRLRPDFIHKFDKWKNDFFSLAVYHNNLFVVRVLLLIFNPYNKLNIKNNTHEKNMYNIFQYDLYAINYKMIQWLYDIGNFSAILNKYKYSITVCIEEDYFNQNFIQIVKWLIKTNPSIQIFIQGNILLNVYECEKYFYLFNLMEKYYLL